MASLSLTRVAISISTWNWGLNDWSGLRQLRLTLTLTFPDFAYVFLCVQILCRSLAYIHTHTDATYLLNYQREILNTNFLPLLRLLPLACASRKRFDNSKMYFWWVSRSEIWPTVATWRIMDVNGDHIWATLPASSIFVVAIWAPLDIRNMWQRLFLYCCPLIMTMVAIMAVTLSAFLLFSVLLRSRFVYLYH